MRQNPFLKNPHRFLKPISFFRQRVRKLAGELNRLVLPELMFDHQLRQICRIYSPRDIVPRRNGQESSRVVVEPHRIVEAGGLGHPSAETHHPFRTVMEPPRWPESQARI